MSYEFANPPKDCDRCGFTVRLKDGGYQRGLWLCDARCYKTNYALDKLGEDNAVLP